MRARERDRMRSLTPFASIKCISSNDSMIGKDHVKAQTGNGLTLHFVDAD